MQSLIDGQSDLPHSFLAQQWRASKDLNFAAPTGEAGGMGSFLFHAQPTTKSFIILQQEYRLSSYPRPPEEVTNIPLVQRMCSWESDAFEGRPGNADSAAEAAGAGTDGEGGQHLR